MASLLERMNISTDSIGPVRSKFNAYRSSSAPYNRPKKSAKGDVDGQWSHDLYESHNSLSARLNLTPTPPKASLNPIAQKAIKAATGISSAPGTLSIKGASASQGNVVEVSGLVAGTTAEDVVAIFKRCGQITDNKPVSKKGEDPRIRITFKSQSSASSAVQKFHNQPADGKILSVRIVGSSATGTALAGRLGGSDGLGLVREEGSVDVLMVSEDSGTKMRSDALIKEDPRAQVLIAPPGTNPAEYLPAPANKGTRRDGPGRGRNRRGGKRGGGIAARMDLD